MNPLQDFKKEIKVFFIVAAVSAVLAVAGIVLLKGTEGNQVSNTPAPSPQPQGTEGWQTYRNNEFGFEVKYPQENEDFYQEKTSSEGYPEVQFTLTKQREGITIRIYKKEDITARGIFYCEDYVGILEK